MEAAAERVREEFGENNIVLAVIAKIGLEAGQDQGIVEQHYLAVDEMIKRRKHFERKNGRLHNTSLNRISITGT
jgi:hypothetical protein